MSGFSDALEVSASGLRAQSARLRLVSENIANSDTPGYRRKIAPFEMQSTEGMSTVSMGKVTADKSQLDRIHDPSHPLADASGYFEGSNVNLIVEIADAREAQRTYEANLKMFDQARQMSSRLYELLRR
ncbi:MAG: flagellar basal body rod protein FlgC [Rhodobacteraceae bacterium]|nr:flagellar basal body rod protein FlgC [Paracoccaceae bacterium]